MSFYKPPRFRFLLANLLPGWNSVGQRRRWGRPCVRVYVHVRSRDRERKKEREEYRWGERKEERDRSVWPRRWTPRVSPRRRNGKSAAAGVRWTHSLSLARPATQPSSSTSSSARAYVLRLHMHVHAGRGGREARGTPIHAGFYRRIIAERIVIAFFAMVRNGLAAHNGPASLRRDERQGWKGRGRRQRRRRRRRASPPRSRTRDCVIVA